MATDLVALANKIKNQRSLNTQKSPLTPSTSDYSDLLPSQPTYKPYRKEEFDSTVEGGPGSDLGWTWTKGVKSKQLFDNEQQAKADNVYKQYQTELQKWQDAFNVAKAQKDLEQQNLNNYNTQLTAQGLTPMTSLGDLPSVQIRQLGQAWQNTTDPTLRDQYHQQALQVAQKAGLIPEGYTGSVNGLATLSAAGTPSYERTYKDQAYKDAVAQQEWENQLAQSKYNLSVNKASGSGSSGGGGNSGGSLSGNNDYYQAALIEMANGQNRHRKAIMAGENRSPHNYMSYVQTAINKANSVGIPLSAKQIEALIKQANYMTQNDANYIKQAIGDDSLVKKKKITVKK